MQLVAAVKRLIVETFKLAYNLKIIESKTGFGKKSVIETGTLGGSNFDKYF